MRMLSACRSLLLCAAAAAWCNNAAARGDLLGCLPGSVPGYATPKGSSQESVIVFLHGLHGDARATWTSTPTRDAPAAAWPCIVLDDDETFAPSSVYLASYRSKALDDNPGIDEAATTLAGELKNLARVFDYRNVTLVVHSMGGIVAAKMLTLPRLLDEEQRKRIRLVVFLGTPALPTEAADICAEFGVNRQCDEMRDAKRMESLWADWDRLSPRPNARCVAEGKWMFLPRFAWEWPWRPIVPEDSAYRPCASRDHWSLARGEDHAQLVKPSGAGADPHRHLSVAFASCVRPAFVPRPASDGGLTEAAARWFGALRDELAASSDATLPLRAALDLTTPFFWAPHDPGQPSFELQDLGHPNAGTLAGILRDQAPILMTSVAWVRRVAAVAERIPDGAFGGLTDRMRDAGGLRPDDVVLAVQARPGVRGQPLLLLREQAGSPMTLRLLGFLVVPQRSSTC